jgi:hypothetical protein
VEAALLVAAFAALCVLVLSIAPQTAGRSWAPGLTATVVIVAMFGLGRGHSTPCSQRSAFR